MARAWGSGADGDAPGACLWHLTQLGGSSVLLFTWTLTEVMAEYSQKLAEVIEFAEEH